MLLPEARGGGNHNVLAEPYAVDGLRLMGIETSQPVQVEDGLEAGVERGFEFAVAGRARGNILAGGISGRRKRSAF